MSSPEKKKSKQLPPAEEEKKQTKMVWRMRIDMDNRIKRPYSPSIEVITSPGEMVTIGGDEEVPTPATLSVMLRSCARCCYGVFGLRFPDGVDRKGITCEWDEDMQECVLAAPYNGPMKEDVEEDVEEEEEEDDDDEDEDEQPPLLMTGSAIGFNGCSLDRFKPKGLNLAELYATIYNPPSTLKVGAPSMNNNNHSFMEMISGCHEVQWCFNHLDINPIALPYEIVEEEVEIADAGEKPPREYSPDFFDGDGYYEKQGWFRNPVIKVRHTDDEGGLGRSNSDPYGESPFVANK